MIEERREHIRVALSIKSTLSFPDGFVYNIPVADISVGGIRLDFPVFDELRFYGECLLKIYFQPDIAPLAQSYLVDIPCRLVRVDDRGAGIEFLNPGPVAQETVSRLVHAGHSSESDVFVSRVATSSV